MDKNRKSSYTIINALQIFVYFCHVNDIRTTLGRLECNHSCCVRLKKHALRGVEQHCQSTTKASDLASLASVSPIVKYCALRYHLTLIILGLNCIMDGSQDYPRKYLTFWWTLVILPGVNIWEWNIRPWWTPRLNIALWKVVTGSFPGGDVAMGQY